MTEPHETERTRVSGFPRRLSGQMTQDDAGQDLLAPGGRFQRDEHDLIEAVTQYFADGQRQAGLANPPKSGQGHQPHLGPAQQRGDLVDGLLPPHQRGGTNRQLA